MVTSLLARMFGFLRLAPESSRWKAGPHDGTVQGQSWELSGDLNSSLSGPSGSGLAVVQQLKMLGCKWGKTTHLVFTGPDGTTLFLLLSFQLPCKMLGLLPGW